MQDMNWDDLRTFLAVAQAGQLGKAAKSLKLDPTTIGRRLRRLETTLDQRLFERTRDGQSLTEAGEELLAKVEPMSKIAREIEDLPAPERGLVGTLRLSVSEGFGSEFLASFVAVFARQHPALTLEIVASSGFLSPSKREADIAVMLSRPKAGQVVCRKLADYRLMLYASNQYIDSNQSALLSRDLGSDLTFISYVPDLLYAPELDYLDDFQLGLKARIRSSSIRAQQKLIEEGAGIGVLPCFIGDSGNGLRRVCPERAITRSFWIVSHRDTQGLSRVRDGKQWLLECAKAGRGRLMPPC